MKVKLYIIFPDYQEVHREKDPGIIARLMGQWMEVSLLSYHDTGEEFCRQMDEEALLAGEWLPQEPCCIMIFHGGRQYGPLIERARAMGHRIVLKMDTDGHMFMRPGGPFSDKTKEILHTDKVSLYNYWRHWRHLWRIDRWADKHSLDEMDWIAVETLTARESMIQRLPKLRDKIVWLPNGAFFAEAPANVVKKPWIIAVGRWEDHPQKNPELLFQVIKRVLPEKPQWQVQIIGSYDNQVKGLYQSLPSSLQERVCLNGSMSHAQLLDMMEMGKILFSPSRWESFSLVSVEGLSRGCSVVCTPCAMQMQTAGGLLGMAARSWREEDVANALYNEMGLWELNLRDGETIRCSARPLYDWHGVAARLKGLMLPDEYNG